MDIKIDISGLGIHEEEQKDLRMEAGGALDRLWSGKEPMTGWVQAPLHQDKKEMDYLLNVADIIKAEAELMVVIGVGGAYTGAKAAIEALPKSEDGIEVKFAGINFCSAYHRRLIEEVNRKNTVICVISKSGSTLEVRAAFDILKELMIKKYGSKEHANKRIIAITDKETGTLRDEAEREGYITFDIPKDTTGRYAALTPMGLLPMAVAGIDIRSLLDGAAKMAVSPVWDLGGTDYGIARFLMYQAGKTMEVLEFFDTRFEYFGEWLKQLYSESEGKEGKGLFPTAVNFTSDIHSIGQFLQQGRKMFFETVILTEGCADNIEINDGPLKGMTLGRINRAASDWVIDSRKAQKLPIAVISVPEITPYNYGQLLYFFEITCAVTSMMMGVNPFDQPGVDGYKKEIREILL